MSASDIFGSNSPKKKEIGFKARSKTRYLSGNGSLLGTSMNGSTMRIRNVPKKEGRKAPVRIRKRFEQQIGVVDDDIKDSNKDPESPKLIAAEPAKEVEKEDLDDSVHLIVPRRRKVDMSKSKSVMMRSKMESTPAAPRHKRSNLRGILNEIPIEQASMLGGRMETPKDDSFENKKISRVTEPIQLQLDEDVENSSYALFGSESSSFEEKSAEVLVPETPLPQKKSGICNRNSSPLKEIQQNIISSSSCRLPTPISNSVSITGTSVVLEKSSPVKTTSPGAIPLREFASPSKKDQAPSEDPFASLDESSYHSCNENTPLKSKVSTKNLDEKLASPELQTEISSETRNIDPFASLDECDLVKNKQCDKMTERVVSDSPVKDNLPPSQDLFASLDDSSFQFHVENTPLKANLRTQNIVEELASPCQKPLQLEPPNESENVDPFVSLDQNDTAADKQSDKMTKRVPSNSSVKDSSFSFHVQNTPLKSNILTENTSTTKVMPASPEKPSQDVEEKQTTSESKTSMKRKSESISPTTVPKLQKLDKSRLTINKLDVGNVSKRPRRTLRKRVTQAHELDETPTIRLSQSPVKPELIKPKEVKAKPSRTAMRRRRKTSIGETPELRESLPFAKGRRFSRNIPDDVDSSYSESTYRRHTRQSIRTQQNPTTSKPLAARDVPIVAEVSAKPIRRQSIRPRSKMRTLASSGNEPAQESAEIRVTKIRPRVRTKISTTSALPDRIKAGETTEKAAKRSSIRPRLEEGKEKEPNIPAKPLKSKEPPKIPQVSAGSRRRTRQSVALEASRPVVPIRRRELEARPTANVKTQHALTIEIPALPSKFKDPKKQKEKHKKPRSKHFDAGLDNIGIECDFKIPLAPKPATVPGRMGQTMGLENRSIFDVTGAFSRKHLSTSMLMKTMSKRVFEDEDDYVPTEEVKRALAILKQDSAVTINSHLKSLRIKQIEKIGEGVFGEVFMGDVGGQKLILKIIPVDGETHINSSPQKPIREVLGEFLIASALETANLAGFCHVKKATVCKGIYAKPLRDAWQKFDKEKESENDKPWEVLKDKSQLYMILVMENCGTDLDAAKLSAKEAVHLIKDISETISRAERAIEFEHRDLHTGNILVQRIDEKLVPTVIDFTLSRAKHPIHGPIFADLELDHEIFEGSGDPQFEVYRDMQVESQKDWSKFCPTTNVLWLKFLAGWLGRNINPSKTSERLKRFSSSSSLPHSSEEFLSLFVGKFNNMLK